MHSSAISRVANAVPSASTLDMSLYTHARRTIGNSCGMQTTKMQLQCTWSVPTSALVSSILTTSVLNGCINCRHRLHAVSPGRRPDKQLMLFLHGFPECWYSWRHQMVAFQNDYDVVAIDMRGYNTSDKPKVPALNLPFITASWSASLL